MILGSLDEIDLVAGRERHDRLLPARAAAFVLAHALPLALVRGRAHGRDLDVEDLLTAWRISTLLASTDTLKVTAFSSSFLCMLFSVISGLTSTFRGSRFMPAPPAATRAPPSRRGPGRCAGTGRRRHGSASGPPARTGSAPRGRGSPCGPRPQGAWVPRAVPAP